MSIFGDRLIQALDEKHLTQTWLHEQTGLGRAHINDIIKGRHDASLKAAVVIADALDVSLDWLTGRDCELKANIPDPL